MTVHEQAVDAAMEIECKKDSLRQNQDGTWKLVLTVAPDGLPDAIMKAPPGVRYRAFFVEVDDNEQPVKHEKPKKRFHEMPLSQQAALRCQDETFQTWAGQHDESFTIGWLYATLGIESRKEFDSDETLGRRWIALNADFESQTGHTAEMR